MGSPHLPALILERERETEREGEAEVDWGNVT